MDSKVKIYLERAENKMILAKTSFDISLDSLIKTKLGVPEEQTFYNDVIMTFLIIMTI